MDVQAEVDREKETVARITAVAHYSPCIGFADLLGWDESSVDHCELMRNPGATFESPRRIVVFHFIAGELRYYAGGWCSGRDASSVEYERMCAEPSESGTFATVRAALALTERYLVEERALREIDVPREVQWCKNTVRDADGTERAT